MKVSNFSWTDKDSKRWFILLSNGHVGPYTLSHLLRLHENKKLSLDNKVWAEGLVEPISFNVLLNLQNSGNQNVEEEELPPPIPKELESEINGLKTKNEKLLFNRKLQIPLFLIFIFFIISIFFINSQKQFYIPRLGKMSLDMHQRILNENSFEGWGKTLFFKEYFAQDHSQIWLVTSGYQNCDVDVVLKSLKGKLLSLKDEEISFTSQGHLSGHVVEFTSFEFTKGLRIIPGLYEMDVKATNCKWDGLLLKLMNIFNQPVSDYIARMKIILFPAGPLEFYKNLDNIQKKKILLKENGKKISEIFWQDLTQKFQTLEAITLQVEQLFLDFLDTNPKMMKVSLKAMIDQYSKKFGTFLTLFTAENEKSFNSSYPIGLSQKTDYELMVKLTTKTIGLESMRLIEELQGMEDFSSEKKLLKLSSKVKNKFSNIKKEINQKLTQIAQDQENLQSTY